MSEPFKLQRREDRPATIEEHRALREENAALRAELATSRELCTKYEAAVGEDVGEILKLREQLVSAREQTIEGLAQFFEESVHLVWVNDEIADCLRGMIPKTDDADLPTAQDVRGILAHPDDHGEPK